MQEVEFKKRKTHIKHRTYIWKRHVNHLTMKVSCVIKLSKMYRQCRAPNKYICLYSLSIRFDSNSFFYFASSHTDLARVSILNWVYLFSSYGASAVTLFDILTRFSSFKNHTNPSNCTLSERFVFMLRMQDKKKKNETEEKGDPLFF